MLKSKLFISKVILFSFVLMAGCGDKFSRNLRSGFTDVVLKTNPQASELVPFRLLGQEMLESSTFAPPSNQTIIYAVKSGGFPDNIGKRTFTTGAGAAAANWSIPNGSYYFYLLGYAGALMASQPVCSFGDVASVNQVNLNGGTVAVNFPTPSNPLCVDNTGMNHFGNFTTSSWAFKLVLCDTSVSNAATFGDDCSTIAGSGGGFDPGVSSARFSYTEVDEFNSQHIPLQTDNREMSGCFSGVPATGVPGSAPAGFRPVVGNATNRGFRPIKTEVFLYTNNACSGSPDVIYIFNRGISEGFGNNTLRVTGGAGISVTTATDVQFIVSGGPSDGTLFLRGP